MSVFDQIGNKITNAGQETAAKAKNFAEATKLNSRIGDCEKQVSQLFLEIGKAYYENHAQDDNAEERQRIEQVRGLYGEIELYKEQIRKLKGVEYCTACGAEVPIGSAFCSACGAKLQMVKVQETKCPNCNAQLQPEDLFCAVCGTKITKEGV